MMMDVIDRKPATAISHAQRFTHTKPIFSQQFYGLYCARIQALRAHVKEAAMQKWPNVPIMDKILDAKDSQTCIVVGTVFKEMQLKPNVLEDLSTELSIPTFLPQHKYTHEDDTILLEDESGRLAMQGVVEPSSTSLSTGTVIGVLGSLSPSGEFVAEDFTYSGIGPQSALPERADDAYVMLISGLSFGSTTTDPLLANLLVDFVSGNMGREQLASQIVRTIVAGNSVSDQKLAQTETTKVWSRKRITAEQSSVISSNMSSLDIFMSELASTVPVDMMTGEKDPQTKTLPQQPLHPCLLPISSKNKNFCCVPNPYDVEVDGVRIVGTSGQPVTNALRYVNSSDSIDMLEQQLLGRHLAPTAPDTLNCLPFTDKDPFVLEDTPHVLFAGNQDEFKTKLLQSPHGKVRLISVPDFSKTGDIVLLNLRNLEAQAISFKSDI